MWCQISNHREFNKIDSVLSRRDVQQNHCQERFLCSDKAVECDAQDSNDNHSLNQSEQSDSSSQFAEESVAINGQSESLFESLDDDSIVRPEVTLVATDEMDDDLEELHNYFSKDREKRRSASVLDAPRNLEALDLLCPPLMPTFDVAAYANKWV